MLHFACASILVAAASMAAEPPFPRVAASSVYATEFAPERAFDGNRRTRWASAGTGGEQWLTLEFGRRLPFQTVAVRWEAAFATEYALEVSDDGAVWRRIAHRTDGRGGVETFAGLSATGRMLRVSCLRPGPHPLYSIWEVEFPDPATAAEIARIHADAEAARRQAVLARCQSAGATQIVFAARENGPDGHWYANFSYYAEGEHRVTYRKHGRLAVLDLATGTTRRLIDDPDGTVRDPAVHYDGRTILFSWRRGGSTSFHLYEIQSDGSGLRQLTDGGGPYDDIEPAWLPDDRIVFVSSRCRRWVNCWLTQVATLHRCNRDGSDVHMLSANIEHDNTPWPLPDGRVAYMRWEYVDRSQVHYHHLWSSNPDGTAQQILFGNFHPGSVFIDARPVPGSERIVLIDSPGHGQLEHMGHVAVLDPKGGPDDLGRLRRLTAGADYRDPWAVDTDTVLAARGRSLVAVGTDGAGITLFTLGPDFGPADLHEPRPLIARPREARIPDRIRREVPTGEYVLSDVYEGRNMAGVPRGTIRRLLVLESLPKPINFTGGMEPLSYGGTFTLERIIGTVPVEEDGSTRFELPALRSFFFIALDKDDRPVKRMQSFTSVMPGEQIGCVGCHEPRTQAAPNVPGRGAAIAMRRPPSRPEPIADTPDVFDMPRDIQPILDALCVRCHGYDATPDGGPRAARLILSGDRGPMYSHSYYMMTVSRLVSDGRNNPKSNYPPYALGSSASRLMTKIDGSHHGVRATPTQARWLRLWIDSGAPYPGTYAALGSGMIGGYAENQPVMTDTDWPTSRAGADAIDRRCRSCHESPGRLLPRFLSDERGVSFWRPDWSDPRLVTSRHIVFNLSRPEKSLLLLAPLAREAGGWGLCHGPDGAPATVFASADDPDYRVLLTMVQAGRDALEKIGRFDMPHFRPRPEYLREMRRYGILPPGPDDGGPINAYDLDRRYWDSMNHRPPAASSE